MRTIALSLILLLPLSGCVGYNYSHNGDVSVSDDPSQVELRYRSKEPERKPVKVNLDGSRVFRIYDEWKWCGLTIWAIVPVPLWLPTCRNYTDVTYVSEKPIKVMWRFVKTSGTLCGPLVPMRSIEGNFCQKHEDW